MGAEKGSAFLLKVGNGAEPPVFTSVAGMRTTQMSVNGEAVNVTSKDSGGWREVETNEPAFLYTAAALAADGLTGNLLIEVVQLGTNAPSRPAILVLN